jgi:phosphoribosylformylglycinamidine synthase subunit PurL
LIEDASHVLKMAFREEDDVIVLLDGSHESSVVGAQHAAPQLDTQPHAFLAREFSSSEYSETIGGIVAGEPPAIDLAAEKRLQACLVALAAEGAIQSAHDVSEGGLAVAVAESCFASNGFSTLISLENKIPVEAALFGECGARAVVSVRPTSLARVLEIARQYGVGAREIGEVTRGNTFRIEYNGRSVVDSSVETLRDAWANSLERYVTQS